MGIDAGFSILELRHAGIDASRLMNEGNVALRDLKEAGFHLDDIGMDARFAPVDWHNAGLRKPPTLHCSERISLGQRMRTELWRHTRCKVADGCTATPWTSTTAVE